MCIKGALGILYNWLVDMLFEVGLGTEESDVTGRCQIGMGANLGDLSE
jgi:hypothetical protein